MSRKKPTLDVGAELLTPAAVADLRKLMGNDVVTRHMATRSRTLLVLNSSKAISEKKSKGLHEFVSRRLFGAACRLDVGLWVAKMEPPQCDGFWASQYYDYARANGHRWPGQVNNNEWQRFIDLGMIERTEAPENQRVCMFRRLPSALWDVYLMAECAISEQTGERRFYTPSDARVVDMVDDLRRIHAQTSVEDEADVELERRRAMTAAATASKARPEGPNGELRCSHCKEWKPKQDFSQRGRGPGQFKSWCKFCMAVKARERYLSISKVEALNMVGVSFTVDSTHDVVGLSCLTCNRPIRVGQRVCGDARLIHEACMT